MIHYTANHDQTVLSASYWQQYLFGRYRGSHSLPVMNKNGDFNPLFWAASIDNSTNTVYFKVGSLSILSSKTFINVHPLSHTQEVLTRNQNRLSIPPPLPKQLISHSQHTAQSMEPSSQILTSTFSTPSPIARLFNRNRWRTHGWRSSIRIRDAWNGRSRDIASMCWNSS